MSMIGSQWQVGTAAIVLTTWMTAIPIHAQKPGTVAARSLAPLAASVQAAAVENSRLLTQTPASQKKRLSCGKSVAMGLAIGAGAGFAAGWGVLASTGGSDEANAVLLSFTGIWTGVGGVLGATACRK
jgi:hypothetical protein